jgi:hypothetical protein
MVLFGNAYIVHEQQSLREEEEVVAMVPGRASCNLLLCCTRSITIGDSSAGYFWSKNDSVLCGLIDRFPIFIETETMHIYGGCRLWQELITYGQAGHGNLLKIMYACTQTSEHYCPPIPCVVLVYKMLIMKHDTHNILLFLEYFPSGVFPL